MHKLKISMVDRSAISNMVPKTGDIETIKKVQSWLDILKETDDEKKVELSFNQIRDPKEKDKALNDWYNTENDFEMPDDLFDYLVDEIKKRDEAKGIAFHEPIKLYEKLLAEAQA